MLGGLGTSQTGSSGSRQRTDMHRHRYGDDKEKVWRSSIWSLPFARRGRRSGGLRKKGTCIMKRIRRRRLCQGLTNIRNPAMAPLQSHRHCAIRVVGKVHSGIPRWMATPSRALPRLQDRQVIARLKRRGPGRSRFNPVERPQSRRRWGSVGSIKLRATWIPEAILAPRTYR